MCQRKMSCKVTARVKRVHWTQGPEIMALWLQDMYLQLRFSPEAARLLIRKQRLDSPERIRVLTDKNDDDIGNVVIKPGGKSAIRMSNKWQQVSIIAQENLKLAIFLFHHW